jgi:superfamily II DNA/RNA helicase
MTVSLDLTVPTTFTDLGVPDILATALEKSGITAPFPIQAATLPDCLGGRDVCGRAPTGSGKTLAFGLAILSRIAKTPADTRRGRRAPVALVLVPTRELAAQIDAVITPLGRSIGAFSTTIYGGVAYGKQLSSLQRGVDIVIACPGRLTDLIERRAVDLSHVEIVVIDEADRMSDMGFLPAVRRLLDLLAAQRQILLFSATLEGPVDKLIRDYLRTPARHVIDAADTDHGDVAHHFWQVEHQDRVNVATQVVQSHGPAIVFCRTKRGADRLTDRMVRSGVASAAIHGDRSQKQRDLALADFRAGRIHVLVATDVAARGIHVDAVPLIVHFDPPNDATDYVHRSGRTGRAGADGTVISLVGREHLSLTKQIQQRLGLEHGVSSPDASFLATVPGATAVTWSASTSSGMAPSSERRSPSPSRSFNPSSRRPSRRKAPRAPRR